MNHEEKPPLINPYDEPLAKIQPGERDTSLNQRSKPATSHRREQQSAPADTQPDDVLSLPRGALVAMRKSGGLAFSVREVVVYRNGRVARRSYGSGRGRNEPASEWLTEDQMTDLTYLVSQTSFSAPAGAGRQSPDTLVTEITARVGRKVKRAEIAQGRVPGELAPLVGWLTHLLSESGDAE